MPAETDVINRGLRLIGAQPIVSRTDGTPPANAANDIYDEVRLALLRSHPWNFATKRVQLAQLSSTPAIKFDFEYQLPTDYLRVVKVTDNDEGLGHVDHKVEDGKILTSSDQCWLVYIYQLTDPNKMSTLFREYVSSLLAQEAAIGLVNSNTLHQLMTQEAQNIERRARGADSQEDMPPEMPVGSWVRSRHGRADRKKWGF